MRSKTKYPMTNKEYIEHLAKLVPPGTKVYLTTVEYRDAGYSDYCDDQGNSVWYDGDYKKTTKLNRKAIVQAALDWYKNEGFTHWEKSDDDNVCSTRRPPKNLKEVLYDVAYANGADSEWGMAWVETPSDYHKRNEEEERKACSQLAAEICSKYKVKPDSIAFVKAIKKHYNGIIKREHHFRDDGEMRAERYATCMMGRAGRDAFLEDNDYSSSLIMNASENLDRLMNYLNRYAPLLMARYNELKLRKKAKRNEN